MPRSLVVPILGDDLYGGATTTRLHFSAYAGIIPEGRLFLHSSSISFWVRVFFKLPFTSTLQPEADYLPRGIGEMVFASAFV